MCIENVVSHQLVFHSIRDSTQAAQIQSPCDIVTCRVVRDL
jgi:hypothetical protein